MATSFPVGLIDSVHSSIRPPTEPEDGSLMEVERLVRPRKSSSPIADDYSLLKELSRLQKENAALRAKSQEVKRASRRRKRTGSTFPGMDEDELDEPYMVLLTRPKSARCCRAKLLLQSHGFAFTELPLADHLYVTKALTGHFQLPQLFVNGRLIGSTPHIHRWLHL